MAPPPLPPPPEVAVGGSIAAEPVVFDFDNERPSTTLFVKSISEM